MSLQKDIFVSFVIISLVAPTFTFLNFSIPQILFFAIIFFYGVYSIMFKINKEILIILNIIFFFILLTFILDYIRFQGSFDYVDRVIYNQVLNFFLSLLVIFILTRRIEVKVIIDNIFFILDIFTIVNIILIILFIGDWDWALKFLDFFYNKKMVSDYEGINTLLDMNKVLKRPLGLFFGSNQLGFYGVVFFFLNLWRKHVQPKISLSKLYFFLLSSIFILLTSQSRTAVILFVVMNLALNFKKSVVVVFFLIALSRLNSLDSLDFRQLDLLSLEKLSEKFFSERLSYWIKFFYDWNNQDSPFWGFIRPKVSIKFYESGLLNMIAEMGLVFSLLFIFGILYLVYKIHFMINFNEMKILRILLYFTLVIEFFQGNFFAERMVVINAMIVCVIMKIANEKNVIMKL